MSTNSLQLRTIKKCDLKSLKKLFNEILLKREDKYFHPHSFSQEYAMKITSYRGKDLYYLMIEGDDIIGYGMLRGWDEGFEIPSLAIFIKEEFRSMGYGKLFVEFLQLVAKRKKAKKVMLKVYKKNQKAFKLYIDLGYYFRDEENGQLVGYKKI